MILLRDVINSILQRRGSSQQLLETTNVNSSQREGRLSQAIERFTEARLLQQFFVTGTLVSPDAVQPCNDDEYIGKS